MNRLMSQFQYSLEKELVHLFAVVTVASGTPTLVLAKSKGFASITDNGVGDWTLTLQDKYRRFVFAEVLVQDADGIPAAIPGLKAEDVAGAKTINFVFSDVETPAATDPADGTVYFHVILSRTSAI